jgi:hypothetical protein
MRHDLTILVAGLTILPPAFATHSTRGDSQSIGFIGVGEDNQRG